MKISLAMIVKNEEKTLERALTSAKSFVDEIVVVDTGSTDKTKEIALSLGAKVYDFKWVDDFAKARNFSFSKATMDYILWLDGDEVIPKESVKMIKELKKEKDPADVYLFKTKIYGKDGVQMEFYRERLVRSSLNFRWEGRVHEVITPRGRVEKTEISVEHIRIKPPDRGRNLKIYRKMEEEKKTFSPRETYYYARELYYNSFFDEALEKFEEFVEKWGYKADIEESFIFLSDIYLKKRDFEKAVLTLQKSMFFFNPTGKTLCKTGEVYFEKKDYEKSAFYYRAALIADPQKEGFVEKDYEGLIPYLQLTFLYYALGDLEKSRLAHERAKEISPYHPAVLYNSKYFEGFDT